ncbi:Marvel domain [Phaffia rhodozyma]|uniref:Marvel domain n=1 Tax=Phaffia rhodozyma TaxID=264483 RepID=A0A0F7SHK3_PHARH|nr:Marvel domain [Phaffia rhodozyma]
MAVDTHVNRGHPILFGLLIVFTIIEGAISTWLVNTYNRHNNYPDGSIRDRSRFICFLSWWTLVFSIIFVALFQIKKDSILTSVASHGIWLILTWILWLAAAASITDALGGGLNCNEFDGAHCGQLNALEGFAWVNWILMTVATAVAVALLVRSVRRGDRFTGALV